MTAAPPARRQRKREKTAQHLAATAFALFEAEGFEAVTMEQIASAADVAKGTLYNHFPVKEALLAYQFRQEIASGMAALSATSGKTQGFRQRMTRLLKASAQWNRSRRPYLASYLRYRMAEIGTAPANADQRSGAYAILETLFRSGQEEGAVRTDLKAGELAWLFEFMTTGAVIVWLNQPKDDLERRFLFALAVLLDGAAVAPGSSAKRSR